MRQILDAPMVTFRNPKSNPTRGPDPGPAHWAKPSVLHLASSGFQDFRSTSDRDDRTLKGSNCSPRLRNALVFVTPSIVCLSISRILKNNRPLKNQGIIWMPGFRKCTGRSWELFIRASTNCQCIPLSLQRYLQFRGLEYYRLSIISERYAC